MGNIIFGYIFKLKDIFQRWTSSIFGKLKDPVTGKPKYLSGAALKNILIIGFTAFIVTILIVQIMGRVERSGSSVEAYKKEFLADNGVSARKIDEKNLFAGDPLSNILSGDRSTRDSYLGVKQSEAEPLSVSSCNSLKERIQAGGKLNDKEKKDLNQCLDTGILQVSADEKKFLKALNNAPTDEARAALLKGDKDPVSKLLISSNDLDKLKRGVNELGKAGIKSNEDSLKEAANKAAESNNGPGKSQINALNKALDGVGLSKDDVKNIKAVLPTIEADSIKSNQSGIGSGDDKIQQMKDLAAQIKSNRESLDKANQELAKAQALAQEAARKILRGEAVNDKEAEAAKNVVDAVKARNEAAARAKELSNQYEALKKEIENSLLSVNNEVTEDILSWDSSEEYNKKGSKKKLLKNNISKQENVPKVIPQPTEKNPIAGLGKRLAANESGDKIDINKLIIGDAASNAKLILSPDMKIAAILDTEILVASNQNAQFVKVKILMDVYDPQTNKIAIPKGSYLTGSTSSFNEETGVMDLTLSKVSVGKSRFTVPVKIGSADGSIGLKGEVRDTRGRKLLGAFITSFSAGALDWFGSSVVSSYQKSTNSMTALQGAGLSGGSEVMKKISEMYAQDLNNAPTIFYCPRGVPIVLFPDGE